MELKRRAEQALREERDFVSAILDTLGSLVVVLDMSGRIVRFNQACEQQTGYTFLEVKDKYVWDLFLIAEEVDRFKEIFERRTAQRRIEYECNWLTRDGRQRLIAWSNTVLPNADDVPVYTVLTGVDITDARRLAKLELDRQIAQTEASEGLLQLIVESAPDAFFLADTNGKLIKTNRAASALVERSESDILGRSLSDVLDSTAVPTTPAMLLDRQALGTLYLDTEIKSHTGRIVPLSVSCNVVRDRSNNAKGIMLIARDITQRKHAEQALQESQSRLAGIIGSAWDAIITVDEEQRIVVFNRAAEQIFRCSAKDAIGQRLDRLIPERFRQAHRDHIHCFGNTAVTSRAMYQPGTEVLYGLRADGEEFPIEATISQTASSGQKFYTVILRDISEKKRAEEALRTSEKLAATGRLATTVAHEINNPLEAITNYVFLARNHPSLPDAVQQHLDDANRELRRISLIAQQTLAFYRDCVSSTQVNLSEILDGVLEVYSRRISYKHLSVETRYDRAIEIRAFSGELKRVFSHLIANAIDASSERGKISVRLGAARDWKDSGRFGVRVTIADRGIGIPPKFHSRIFEPFFSTKQAIGTGLGLWVSKSLIEDRGGRIRFRSSVRSGRTGTVFSVFLPSSVSTKLAPPHDLAGEKKQGAIPETNPLRSHGRGAD